MKAIPWTLLLAAHLLSSHSFAIRCWAAPNKVTEQAIAEQITADLRLRRGSNFEPMIEQWQSRFGARAVPTLVSIASNEKLEDTDRYLSVMAIAKLGGPESAPLLLPLLKHRSWMLRSASLSALSALRAEASGAAVLPLLKDPSLLVRIEAVAAVERLNPPGAIQALVESAKDPINYHRGKSQWVPSRVLKALVQLEAKESVAGLKPLLNFDSDPDLQIETVKALEQLTGQHFKSSAPLAEQVREWKSAL